MTSRFDYVFWMGDLNSRLEKGRSQLEELIAGLETNQNQINYDDLIQHDELKRVIDQGSYLLVLTRDALG